MVIPAIRSARREPSAAESVSLASKAWMFQGSCVAEARRIADR
jgi:hypothetical protein